MTAVICSKADTPREFLVDSNKSLLKQSNAVAGRRQSDGWGIAYYSSNGPAELIKSPAPVYKDGKKFANSASKIRSEITIAHIRDASNPRGLKKSALGGMHNTQPFSHSNMIFAHNGTLEIPEEITAFLGRYKKFIRGNNDSEVLFWQFIKLLDSYGSTEAAFENLMDEIWTTWHSCKNRHADKKFPYRGLNLFASDGKSFYALCHYPLKKDPGALMTRGWKWGELALKRENGRIILSSEPAGGENWARIGDLSLATVKKTNGELKLTVKKIAGDFK
ncbi:MAG: class II glutamine amidotransferase [Elusimicrobia bacterium]|nr:class II glutamine amidotransferase [Elusimicrobiota bacterium]